MFIVDTNKKDELFTSLFGSEGLVFTREITLEAVEVLWLVNTVAVDAEGHSSEKEVLLVSLRISDWLLRLEQTMTSTIHLLWPLSPEPRLRQCVSVRLRQHERDGDRSLLFEMDDGMKAVLEDLAVDSAVAQDSIVWPVKKQQARRRARV